MHYATRGPVLCFLAAAFFISILPAQAQEADTGVAIASVSGGGVFGLGFHGAVDGTLALPTSKYLVPFVDVGYSPLTSYAFTYGSNNTGKGLFTSSVFDANAGVRVRFPSKSRDWVPYIGFGAGLLRFDTSSYTSGFNTTATVKTSSNDLAGNVSAGGLYYVTQHVGLAVEAKGYFASQHHFGRATVGVFYQFP